MELKRRVAAGVICLLVVAYVAALVTGHIDDKAKIDLSTVLVVVICLAGAAALASPASLSGLKSFFGRVTSLEVANIKLALADIRSRQSDQGDKLAIMELILPLVLAEQERAHLTNLYHGTTSNYKGNHELRTELRRLRYLTLVASRDYISTATDGRVFDLSELVELTRLGREWAKQIDEMKKQAPPEPAQP